MTLPKKILIVALVCIFVGSGAMFLKQNLQERADEAAYEEAQALVDIPSLPDLPAADLPPLPEGASSSEPSEQGQEEAQESSKEGGTAVRHDPYSSALRKMDLGALQAVSAESKGWIVIPNTRISYPLMQGSDNSYYLTHNYRQQASAAGSIFMDCRNASTLTNFNTIIYGHRMKNGTMFEGLKNYKSLSFWQKHPYVYLSLPGGKSYQYTVFAAYEDSASGESYRINFGGDIKAKQSFLDAAVGASLIQTGVSVNAKDQILTLSTCTGRGYEKRLVVHAKLSGGDALSASASKQGNGEAQSSPQSVPENPESQSGQEQAGA